jgi:predicted GH43/DUF377 family glycosyl hydrolase
MELDLRLSDDGAVVFLPDPNRVVLRPFMPADDDAFGTQLSRVDRILDRVLSLDEPELERELDRVLQSLTGRHLTVEDVLARRFDDILAWRVGGRAVDAHQRLLCGAYFTEEYSFEAAALFNPSVTTHPDQHGVPEGSRRLLFSLRGIGEGHISSIVFRSGIVDAAGRLEPDPPSRWAVSPVIDRPAGDDGEVSLAYRGCDDLSQIVIFPVTYQQRHGIEDLRLVRFVEEDGSAVYLGTYTAFSGEAVRQELLRTTDFVEFELRPLEGALSATKGMALFPRRIDGQFAMVGRHDHENIWLLKSDRLHSWNRGEIVLSPRWPWEFVQIGICSPPIEIDEGWLCITHGVGSIRNYCLGACLLDKRDPGKLLARSTEPLMRPGPQQRDGYVPNVVYSCGAMVIGRTLLLPYGVADSFSSFAAIPLDALLATLA